MKAKRAFFLPLICICLLVSLPVSSSALRGHSTAGSQSGLPVDGLQLRLSLSPSNSGNGGAMTLQIEFRNSGDREITLNLGSLAGNGEVQLPDGIGLTFTDAAGKTRTFKFCDKNYSFYIAGRRDDFVVPLQVGAIYTLKLTLDQFWCVETNEFEVKLLPGKNQLTALFEGRGSNHVLDQPVKPINFWLGKVQSNNLVIER